MTQLILHHYDASPFSQKALRMLGLKGLEWHSVETPMVLPKPDLVVLTGGYRGTPVLQIGADVYIDTQRIALELEQRFPEPTLFPGGDSGLALALVKWGDAFFRSGLWMAVALLGPDWPDAFRRDREALFTDLDFGEAETELSHAKAQLRAHAALLERQLDDGRPFLTGDRPSLCDIQAFSVPWFTRASMPVTDTLLAAFPRLAAWEARIAAIGEGERHPLTAGEAHAIAHAATPATRPDVDSEDAQGLEAGMRVEVVPEDARRGAVRGVLVGASANALSVRYENDTVGEVCIHFPRLGYRVIPS